MNTVKFQRIDDEGYYQPVTDLRTDKKDYSGEYVLIKEVDWNSIEKGEIPEMLSEVNFWHPENGKVMTGVVMPDGVHEEGESYPCSHWKYLPKPPV